MISSRWDSISDRPARAIEEEFESPSVKEQVREERGVHAASSFASERVSTFAAVSVQNWRKRVLGQGL